jgi:hypothetical protein
VLDDLLMGTPVAPLYKVLRESGLGESVLSDGLETVLQQATYSVGMKGIKDVEKIPEVRKCGRRGGRREEGGERREESCWREEGGGAEKERQSRSVRELG